MSSLRSESRRYKQGGRNTSLLPSHKLQCFSVACLDMPHLEFGDKIVLPPKILLELQCLKIPTPLLFSIRDSDVDNQLEGDLDLRSCQYCSVQEFSAPDGQVFLPYWLMQNLHVPEGGAVVVTSVVDLPRGVYCRLQPEIMNFLDLAADIGPKLLMETALRRYSVLSEGSTIVVAYRNTRYYVRVAELKPASVVSLCGDVDLETDFMPPDGFDPKRPSLGKSTTTSACTSAVIPKLNRVTDELSVSSDNSTPVTGYGRRLKDGGYVESSDTTSTPEKESRTISMKTLQKAQQIVREKQAKRTTTEAVAAITEANTGSSPLASQVRSAQRAFSTPGYTLGSAVQTCSAEPTDTVGISTSKSAEKLTSIQPNWRELRCDLCLANVSMVNMELHTLHCVKNPAYHKFACSICHEEILRVNKSQHRHCPDCTMVCTSNEALADHQRDEHTTSSKCELCGALFTRISLKDHLDSGQCDQVWVPCSLCGLDFKKKDLSPHIHVCSSRTERCAVCNLYIKITEFDTHQAQCTIHPDSDSTGFLPSPRKASNQNAIDCAYCLQGGFSDIAAVERHVLQDCRIAKSFSVHDVNTNQEESEEPKSQRPEVIEAPHRDEITLPRLAQGRIRRKGDVNALRGALSSPVNNQKNHLGRRTPPAPFTLGRPTLPTGSYRKPKPRPNPQLRSLPKQIPKPVEGPQASSSIARPSGSSSSGDLCISAAGGTSLAAHARSRANTRAKRRPIGNGGRLNKLP